MTDTIQPALTPGEWADADGIQIARTADGVVSVMDWTRYVGGVGLRITGGDDNGDIDIDPVQLPPVMALANHALPDGHPLKITRADVHALQYVAEMREMRDEQEKSVIADLAAKLAALLPPE